MTGITFPSSLELGRVPYSAGIFSNPELIRILRVRKGSTYVRRRRHHPGLQQVLLRHVGRQDVLQQYFVDAPHRVDALLLGPQLGPPQEVRPGGELDLPVQEVEEAEQGGDGQDQGQPEGPNGVRVEG